MENDAIKIDRRIVRTKRSIRNALAAILNDKDIDAITVSELAEKADVSRKTFYNYYRDVYQVLDEIENEMIRDFSAAVDTVDFKRDMSDPLRILQNLTDVIRRDLDLYGHLMRIGRNRSLTAKIALALKNAVKSSLLRQTDICQQQIDLVLDFTITGMLAVYQSWLESPRTTSLEDVSQAVSSLTFSGANGYFANVKNKSE